MIILASAVIISLSNSGIIGKAQDAVDKTNLKQIQEMANVLWLEAYSGGARDKDVLEDAVLKGLEDVDTSKYNINVTTSGVTVTLKGEALPELNEYSFYYDKLYVMEDEYGKGGFVFREDGSVEYYVSDEEMLGITDMFCMQVYEPGLVSYAKGKIAFGTVIGTVSSDGTSITLDGDTAVLSSEEIHGIYKGATYSGVSERVDGSDTYKTEVASVFGTDNYYRSTIDWTTNGETGTENSEYYIELVGRNHLGYKEGEPYVYVSLNGQKLFVDGMVLTITEVPENYVEDNTPQLNMYGFYYDQMYASDELGQRSGPT